MGFEYFCNYNKTIKITEVSYSRCEYSLNNEEFRALTRKFNQHLNSLKNQNKILPCLSGDYCKIKFREELYYIRYEVFVHNLIGRLDVTSIEKTEGLNYCY